MVQKGGVFRRKDTHMRKKQKKSMLRKDKRE